MKFEDIKNESERKFSDISSEFSREYVYPAGVGTSTISVHIDCPIGLHVSKSGHYIIDAQGTTHYVPFGFIHLHWKADPNIVV
jgi:hypothetical protein